MQERNASEVNPHDPGWLDVEQLQAIAGTRLELWDLKRLRRAGALQPAEQTWPRGVHGSVTCYPPEAGEQLRRIIELRQEERRLDELVFTMWWERRWVDRDALRRALASLLDDAGLREVRKLVKRHREVSKRADVLFHEVQRRVRRNTVLRYFRSQLPGRRVADVQTVVYTLTLLMFGAEPAWTSDFKEEPQPDDLLRAASGCDRAAADTVRIDGEPIGPLIPPSDAIVDRFRPLIMAGILPVTNLPSLLASATDEELDAARDDVQQLIEPFARFARTAERLLGKGALGLGIFGTLPPSHPIRAFLTVCMVAVRRAWTTEEVANRDAIVAALASTTRHEAARGHAKPAVKLG